MTDHLMKNMHPDQERAAKALAMIARDATAEAVETKPGVLDQPSEFARDGAKIGSQLHIQLPNVTEGPAIKQYSPYDIPLGSMPFAYQLRRCLERGGAVIGLEENNAPGMPIHGGAFVQLHVEEHRPEALGHEILKRFGPHVTFGMLAIPHGLECVTWSRSGRVWVRHVVDYYVATDGYIQRWDVLVRKT